MDIQVYIYIYNMCIYIYIYTERERGRENMNAFSSRFGPNPTPESEPEHSSAVQFSRANSRKLEDVSRSTASPVPGRPQVEIEETPPRVAGALPHFAHHQNFKQNFGPAPPSRLPQAGLVQPTTGGPDLSYTPRASRQRPGGPSCRFDIDLRARLSREAQRMAEPHPT